MIEPVASAWLDVSLPLVLHRSLIKWLLKLLNYCQVHFWWLNLQFQDRICQYLHRINRKGEMWLLKDLSVVNFSQTAKIKSQFVYLESLSPWFQSSKRIACPMWCLNLTRYCHFNWLYSEKSGRFRRLYLLSWNLLTRAETTRTNHGCDIFKYRWDWETPRPWSS